MLEWLEIQLKVVLTLKTQATKEKNISIVLKDFIKI